MKLDPKELSAVIKGSLRDAMFFCDTSVFDENVDDLIWDALLEGRERVAVVPDVATELERWLETNQTHAAARAVADRDESIKFVGGKDFTLIQSRALEYYVNLLGFRKRLLQLKILEFERLHERAPTDEERKSLRSELHATWGSRAYSIATKDKPNSRARFADEALVSMGVIYAVITGRTVVLLSKDEDVAEQFYKLQWLLDTHYRSMLLADYYVSEFSRFRTYQMPRGIREVDEAFVGKNDILVETWETLPDELLPDHCNFTPIHCWIVGDYFSELAFGATRELRDIIRVKGETKGQNTARLGTRNCHLWLAPLPLPQDLRLCSAIVEDRTLPHPRTDVAFPALDIYQAIYSGERFKHFEYTTLWTPSNRAR